jgi:hypothetical protein
MLKVVLFENNDMPRLGQLRYPARVITTVTLMALAVTGFGDDNTLPPVRVDGVATKTASKSYKFCWSAIREVNGVREDRFFAEPIIEAKGHKLVPADTTLTIQSQNGAIDVRVSRDGAVENFPISNELLAENPLVVVNKPKESLDLTVQIRIPVPNQKRFKYSELVAGLKQANHLFRKALGILGIFAPQTKDLTFVFASASTVRPAVTVLWKGSPKTTIGDDDGMLAIRIDESTKEDPDVLVTEIPEKIVAIPQRRSERLLSSYDQEATHLR